MHIEYHICKKRKSTIRRHWEIYQSEPHKSGLFSFGQWDIDILRRNFIQIVDFVS